MNDAEMTHIMWEQCLDLWRHQLEVLNVKDEIAEVAMDAGGATLRRGG